MLLEFLINLVGVGILVFLHKRVMLADRALQLICYSLAVYVAEHHGNVLHYVKTD